MFTLQTVPAEPDALLREVAENSGFSPHVCLAANASQRDKIERLARYVSRPPVATEGLSLTQRGYVRYPLNTPHGGGTTHVIFEPDDFIVRLAALVPKPRVNLASTGPKRRRSPRGPSRPCRKVWGCSRCRPATGGDCGPRMP